MDESITVLVTGVGGGGIGNQILGALRVAPAPYRILVADADAFSHGLYLGHSAFVLPRADRASYSEAVFDIVKRNAVQVLLPGTEAELNSLIGQSADLHDLGCVLLANPEPVVKLCAHKGDLARWLSANGFSSPKTANRERWEDLAREVGFPLVAKPPTNSGGSKGVTILAKRSEAEALLRASTSEILFQEYVADGNHEYTVGVLMDRQGGLIDSIVIHRKLTGLSLGQMRNVGGRPRALSTGISQGFIVRNHAVQRQSEEIARAIGARGPLNIQCRLVGSQISVFEVHARFSGTCAVRASAGFNEPDVLIRNFVSGERFGRISYRTDVAAIRGLNHVLVSRDDFLGDFPEEI